MSTDDTWGADVPISIPQAMDSTDVGMADLGGFCFTPDGLRINLSQAEREQAVGSGYGPQASV